MAEAAVGTKSLETMFAAASAVPDKKQATTPSVPPRMEEQWTKLVSMNERLDPQRLSLSATQTQLPSVALYLTNSYIYLFFSLSLFAGLVNKIFNVTFFKFSTTQDNTFQAWPTSLCAQTPSSAIIYHSLYRLLVLLLRFASVGLEERDLSPSSVEWRSPLPTILPCF